jgi:glycosyltransferase involved in cell wall biosynthesis
MKVAIGIPCLNEGDTIEKVLKSLPKNLDGVDEVVALVVDDGSEDQTAALAARAGATVLSHGTNKGLGVAFATAVEWCLSNRVDILVTVDGDGQFNVSDIPKLIAPIMAKKSDFVSASRFMDSGYFPEGIPPVKLWGNRRMAKLISGLTGKKFYDVACGFRAYSKDCLLNLNLFGKFTYTQETFLDLSYKGFMITEVPTRVAYFKDRRSRIASSILKYGLNTSKIIIRVYRDYYPLRFFWAIGGVFGMLGLLLGLYFFFHYLQTGRFYGALWAGLGSGFSVGLAVFLIVIGLVVDMLDRMRINQERQLALLKKQFYYRRD